MTSLVQTLTERVSTLEEGSFRGAPASEEMEELKQMHQEFRETIGSTVRALAGDTLKLARGEPVEFCHQYVDKYDSTMEFRGNAKRSEEEYRSSPAQKSKYDFEPKDAETELTNEDF